MSIVQKYVTSPILLLTVVAGVSGGLLISQMKTDSEIEDSSSKYKHRPTWALYMPPTKQMFKGAKLARVKLEKTTPSLRKTV